MDGLKVISFIYKYKYTVSVSIIYMFTNNSKTVKEFKFECVGCGFFYIMHVSHILPNSKRKNNDNLPLEIK